MQNICYILIRIINSKMRINNKAKHIFSVSKLALLLMLVGISATAQAGNKILTSAQNIVLNGDLNNDGKVDIGDVVSLTNIIKNQGNNDEKFDDGDVNYLTSIIMNQGKEAPIPSIPSYELVNDNAKAYLTEVNYTNDTQYLESFVSNYRANFVTDLTLPKPVMLEWHSVGDNESLKLFVSSDLNFSDAWTYSLEPDIESFDVYNLIPNRVYYWKVEGHNGTSVTTIESGHFYTTGSRRLLLIPGEHLGNCRDLGGMPCAGGFIKYGKLIRGAEVLRDDGGPYMKISDEGMYEVKERIGCSVELDFGDLWRESPLEGKGFEVYRDHALYGFYAYDRDDRGLRTTIGRVCLHNCLELVIQKLSEGKSVYFHCNSGADRTGTFAFIIEALCGVSDNDKSKDYELTSLWATWFKEPYNRYTNYADRFRNAPPEGTEFGYNTMIAYINSLFSGETLNEKVYDMCIKSIDDGGLGISEAQIELLRSLLIENRVIVQAKSYTRGYGDANPVFEYVTEGASLDGVPEITCEATASSPVGTYDIVVKQGSVTNYNVTYVAGTLTITKAPLTISAGTYTKKQGEAMPEFTLTYDGFKNDETNDVLTKQPEVSCQATIASDPGEYDVIVSGGEAHNYEFSYINGKLIVQESESCVSGIIKPTESFDVYTITGILVKKHATSLNGLPKGLYIVNRRIICL